MSWRHRHFSVRPARLANVPCDENASAQSQERHDSSFATLPRGLSSTRVAEASYRVHRRQWIVTAGAVPATTPMWTSRTSWVCEVATWAAGEAGQRALHRAHLTQRMFTRVSAALARFADGASGRHCAVTNARVALSASCSPRTVTTVRAVLAEAAFAVEVRRGTGSSTTPVYQRRPSVWHLTSRRRPVDKSSFCDLPRSRRVSGSVPVGSTPPSEARSAPPRDSSTKKRRQRRPSARPLAPRPLHTQRLAGWLASTSAGLGIRPGHHVVGQLCNALDASHLDLPAWTGPQLVAALNADMRQRGYTWPDQITSPGPFLAQRLRHLPAQPAPREPSVASPSSPADAYRKQPSPAQQSAMPPAEPSAARLAAQRAIREILGRPRVGAQHPST